MLRTSTHLVQPPPGETRNDPRGPTTVTLADLRAGQLAHVLGFGNVDGALEAKLREIGFCEGDEVQLVARGPLGGWPIAVRLNRRIIAMRQTEALCVILAESAT